MNIRSAIMLERKTFRTGIAMTGVLLLAAACSTTTTTTSVSHYSTRKATNKTRYVDQSNIITFPLIVDLDVDDRIVSGSFSGSKVSEEFAKSMAIANAVRQAGADVLVEPFFDITIQDNDIIVEVRGHPAHYKNFRKPATPDDKGSNVKLNLVKPGNTKKTVK